MKKRALITGITGQDGSYLSEYLLAKNYEVHGIVRRVAFEDPKTRLNRIQPILDRLQLHSGSVDNFASVYQILSEVRPHECYHLAAQSYVSYSFEDEFTTMMSNIGSVQYLLSGIRKIVPECRFYFAASSEMFGNAKESPQSEETPFHPRSPYGISKVAGFDITRNYREAYKIHASSGILFNHESPRRGYEFVTRKITSTAVRIKMGLEEKIALGNLDALRDWGHAKEYVKAMWRMLQQDEADDYVIATGESHSVKDFLYTTFGYLNLDPDEFIQIDENLFRPAEVNTLTGNAAKAKTVLNWKHQIAFEDLVHEMVENDLAILKSG